MVPLKKEDIRSFSREDLGGSAQWMVQVVFCNHDDEMLRPLSVSGGGTPYKWPFFIAYNPYKWSKING